MKKIVFGLLLVVSCLLLVNTAWSVPRMINVQGKLTGDPLTDAVTFRIYEGGTVGSDGTLTGGSLRWEKPFTIITEGTPGSGNILVDPTSRIFNVQLGKIADTDPVLPEFYTDTFYLVIEVRGQILKPPQRLVSVPFAITARNLVSGEVIAGTKIPTPSVAVYGKGTTAGGSFESTSGYGVYGKGASAGVYGEGVMGLSGKSPLWGVFGESTSEEVIPAFVPLGALGMSGPFAAVGGSGKGWTAVGAYSTKNYGVCAFSGAVSQYAGVYGGHGSGSVGLLAGVPDHSISLPLLSAGAYGESSPGNYGILGGRFITIFGTFEVGVAGTSDRGHGVLASTSAPGWSGIFASNTADGNALLVGQGKITVSSKPTSAGTSAAPVKGAAGKVTLTGEATSITVYNSYAAADALIFVTPQVLGIKAGVTNMAAGKFDIVIDRKISYSVPPYYYTVTGDIKVNYLIIN